MSAENCNILRMAHLHCFRMEHNIFEMQTSKTTYKLLKNCKNIRVGDKKQRNIETTSSLTWDILSDMKHFLPEAIKLIYIPSFPRNIINTKLEPISTSKSQQCYHSSSHSWINYHYLADIHHR